MKSFLFLYLISGFLHANETAPYLVYLRPGAVLKKLSDQTSFALSKGIYAKVLEKNFDKRDNIIVYDKMGVPQYEVAPNDIVEIEPDIRILPNVKGDAIYPKPTLYQAKNEDLFLDTQVNIHFDYLATSPLAAINNQESTSAVGNRIEVRTLLISLFPVDFGVSLNYEKATWTENFEQTSLSILSFGPHLQKSIYEEDKYSFYLSFGAEFAPIYKTTSVNFRDNFQGVLFDIGAEGLWETDYGKWSLGSHIRRHDVTLISGRNKLGRAIPETLSINSFGLTIGYKYEWDL